MMYKAPLCDNRPRPGAMKSRRNESGTVSTSLVSTNSRIGISLSGGGIRAAIFHLGVLQWLAQLRLLENLSHISTVSGASLAIGLVYAENGGRFPDSAAYLEKTLPAVRSTILQNDIQDRALMSLTVRPWNWRRKVNLVAEAVELLWDVRGRICDLPVEPLWSINCTTFETGKDFRISQKEMGDYKVGYIPFPFISIAEAVAASAGFPVLIGPYRLSSRGCEWKDHAGRALHLWDGGVYDNLGLEALYKIADGGHLTGDLNYLIVSNASSPSGYRKRDFFSPVKNMRRLLDITMDQVDALRTRDVTDYLTRTGNGCYLKIGSAPVLREINHFDQKSPYAPPSSWKNNLTPEQISFVKSYPTTLSSPSEANFDLILRHGYEVARDRIYPAQTKAGHSRAAGTSRSVYTC